MFPAPPVLEGFADSEDSISRTTCGVGNVYPRDAVALRVIGNIPKPLVAMLVGTGRRLNGAVPVLEDSRPVGKGRPDGQSDGLVKGRSNHSDPRVVVALLALWLAEGVTRVKGGMTEGMTRVGVGVVREGTPALGELVLRVTVTVLLVVNVEWIVVVEVTSVFLLGGAGG